MAGTETVDCWWRKLARPQDAELLARPSPRYEPVRLIGHGGSGRVILMHDYQRQEEVAVKVLRKDRCASGSTRARFAREVRVLQACNHPGLVPILDSGVMADERMWYAMPYYPGGSLTDRIRSRGTPSLADVVKLGLEMLDALHHLHGRGIVHRDVKPSNVLWDGRGGSVLGDFGIASMAGERLTRAGSKLGTPYYAPPEQFVDPRLASPASDLYGLGVTLYAAITGEGPSDLIQTDSRARSLARIHPVLRAVLDRATQPQVNARHRSAPEMADELAAALTAPGVDSTEPAAASC